MKAPNALKRVGRSIGVIRTKVRDTVKRNRKDKELVEKEAKSSDTIDARDDFDSENHPVQKEEQCDPGDFLTMMRSGSIEDDGNFASNFDKALIAIENERPEQISLPPQIGEARQRLIQSPPNVKANPMTFEDEDETSSIDALASKMARSMSNLVTRTYSRLVEDATSTVQGASSFSEFKADGAEDKADGEEANDDETEDRAEAVPTEDKASPTDDKDVPTDTTGQSEGADYKDGPEMLDEAREPPETSSATTEVEAATATGASIQTPKPYVDDEDDTVVTDGPEVFIPPTVLNRPDPSLSSRTSRKKPPRAPSVFSRFGSKAVPQTKDPTLARLFDAFRDVMCCPENVDRKIKSPMKEAVKTNDEEEDIDEEIENEEFASVSRISEPESDVKETDSFDEIAEATLLVSDMIKVKGSFTSEQCDQVERALKVLEQKAKKIGVNESDLLAAMASSDDISESKVPSTIGMASC